MNTVITTTRRSDLEYTYFYTKDHYPSGISNNIHCYTRCVEYNELFKLLNIFKCTVFQDDNLQ